MMLLLFFLAQNIDCGNTLEPPRHDVSSEYLQSMFCIKNKKKQSIPLYTPGLIYKIGVQVGISYTNIFS